MIGWAKLLNYCHYLRWSILLLIQVQCVVELSNTQSIKLTFIVEFLSEDRSECFTERGLRHCTGPYSFAPGSCKDGPYSWTCNCRRGTVVEDIPGSPSGQRCGKQHHITTYDTGALWIDCQDMINAFISNKYTICPVKCI